MSRDLAGQREHDVEVRHRQQLGLALGEPLLGGGALALRAMPVAAASCSAIACASTSRSARHARREPPCGSSRSPTSPSSGRGSRDRHWPYAKPVRGRGRYPRPPALDATWRRALGGRSHARLHSCGHQRREAIQRAHDLADHVGGDARVDAPSSRAWRARAVMSYNAPRLNSLKIKDLLRGILC